MDIALINKNKAIVKFDPEYIGFHSGDSESWNYDMIDRYEIGIDHYYEEKGLLYHEDWSWLMPVVDRIEKLTVEGVYQAPIIRIVKTVDHKQNCYIECGMIMDAQGRSRHPDTYFSKTFTAETKIQATHEAIFQFINWLEKANRQWI